MYFFVKLGVLCALVVKLFFLFEGVEFGNDISPG
jgi:hypothetical protein